jgi:BirA family biotin operon repressor/biotin-[acetyl-CoA-carboxylase] ligase
VPGELYRGSAGDTGPYLLVAEHQTQGRGRLGRSWHASPGASLTFSLALALQRADWSALSLAVGVALADALDPPSGAGRPRLRLKWPNDILLAPGPTRPEASARKLAGILIESVAAGARRIAVIGVGINVRPQTLTDTGWGYACLQEIETDVTAPAVLARVARPLIEAVLRFDRAGFTPFAAGFARRDLLAGQSVSTTSAQWPEGVAEGVDAAGALLLRVGAVQQRIQSGEVSLTLRQAEAVGCRDGSSKG